MNEYVCLAPSLHCIQFRVPAKGMVSPTVEISLLTLVNLAKTISCRHAQRPMSQVIVDSVKFLAETMTTAYEIHQTSSFRVYSICTSFFF